VWLVLQRPDDSHYLQQRAIDGTVLEEFDIAPAMWDVTIARDGTLYGMTRQSINALDKSTGRIIRSCPTKDPALFIRATPTSTIRALARRSPLGWAVDEYDADCRPLWRVWWRRTGADIFLPTTVVDAPTTP
jgi:hypothetical protein